ncbi:MAG TPA: PQQ-binding-like beta-propeller repeat protein, partial [Candidatus Bathyarchaeia archaeon]
RWIYNMSGVPGGDSLYGSRGEIYKYTVDLAHGWMTLWNTSRVVSNAGSWIRNSMGTTFNVSQNGYQTRSRNAGYEWNKTIPVGLPGSVNEYFLFDRIIGSNLVSRTAENLISERMNKPIPLWGISVKPGQEGTLLFNTTWTPPQEDLMISFGAVSLEDKVFTLWSKETRQYWGFSLDTGQQLWGPTAMQDYLDIFGQRRFIANGKMFAQGMSGILHCYDVKTGELLWTYSDKDQRSEVLWSNQWSLRPLFITDGKIYMGQSEHSANQPLPRGAPFVAVDIETGEEVWKSYSLFRQTDWGGRAIIGDSIIATMDTYDQRIYAIGKGPTATSIMASPKTSVMGSSVVVEGTVTDISPSTEEYGLAARFPNGVPAVSDESMSDWMLYVHKQFPRPADATGVEVTLSVLDSNNNYREIGKTTADSDGFFSFEWIPDIEGKYTVYASFQGSKSYYPSHAETAFVVNPAPEPIDNTDTTNVPTEPPLDLYLAVATALIIAAIAVVGILLLRKRP